MLLRGTAKHSRQEIEDALDRLRAKLSINGGATGATAHGETVRAQLADTLRLLSEVLREPSFPAAEFDQLKRARLAAIDERRTDPGDVAERTLERYDNPYPAGDVRYAPTVDEEIKQIEAVRLDAAKEFHARFVGGAHAELALVGDFDPEATRALIAELFGSWQSGAPFTRVPDPLVAKRPKEIEVQTPDKANAVLAGELALPLNDTSPDYAAFQVANYILGGSTSSRLWNRIRQQEGISYSVYTYLQPNSFEENTPLVLDAIFAPENMQRLRTALKEELTRAVRDGFTAAEVADAKNALLQRRTLARTQDPRLADDLVKQAYLGRTFAYAAGIDAAIASSTTDQVNAVLRKYVQPERFVSVFAGDFAKLKSK
jgi:zinc protease